MVYPSHASKLFSLSDEDLQKRVQEAEQRRAAQDAAEESVRQVNPTVAHARHAVGDPNSES